MHQHIEDFLGVAENGQDFLSQVGKVAFLAGNGKNILGEVIIKNNESDRVLSVLLNDPKDRVFVEDPPIQFLNNGSEMAREVLKKFKINKNNQKLITGLDENYVGLANSEITIHYNSSILPPNGFTKEFIAENIDEFEIELVFNTNPNGFYCSLTPGDATIEKSLFSGNIEDLIQNTRNKLTSIYSNLLDNQKHSLEGFGKYKITTQDTKIAPKFQNITKSLGLVVS